MPIPQLFKFLFILYSPTQMSPSLEFPLISPERIKGLLICVSTSPDTYLHFNINHGWVFPCLSQLDCEHQDRRPSSLLFVSTQLGTYQECNTCRKEEEGRKARREGRKEDGGRIQKGQEEDSTRLSLTKPLYNDWGELRDPKRRHLHIHQASEQGPTHLWRFISSSSTLLWISLISVATWIFVTNSVPQSRSLANFWKQRSKNLQS